MIQQWKPVRLSWIIVALLVSRTAQATTAQSMHCGGWSIVPSPNSTTYYNDLNSVAAVSPSNVWAVGSAFDQHNPGLTLVEHWDGTRWQVMPSPNAGASGLQGITALSASNLWAVGYSAHATQTLIEHWDGTQWSIVPSPSVGNNLNVLASVSAVSASDIWAVGWDYLGSNNPYRTLIEHWDGTQWSIVASPNPGPTFNELYGVSAVSSTDAWAVGSTDAPRPLLEHWDGTRWSVAHPSRNGNFFGAVIALAANDVWAVGLNSQSTPLTEHWNGSQWHIVPSPSVPNGRLVGAAASSPKDVWAVGLYENFSSLNATLTEHWDGKRWQVVPSPNVAVANGGTLFENFLNGVAVTSSQSVWAVGYYQPRGAFTANTLIEYYC